MIRRPVVVSPVKAILAMRGEEASGLPHSRPKPLTMLRVPGGSRSAMSSSDHEDRGRGLLGGLEHHAIAGGERGRQLPHRHQDGEIPRDDLADDAERLVEMVGDGVVVDLGNASLPGHGRSRRSSGNDRWPAGCRRCVVSRIGLPLSQVSARAIRSRFSSIRSAMLVEDEGALARPRYGPRPPWRHGPHRGPSPRPAASERATSQMTRPVTGEVFSKYRPATGATHWPPMKFS